MNSNAPALDRWKECSKVDFKLLHLLMSIKSKYYLEEIDTISDEEDDLKIESASKLKWNLVIRQVIICSAIWTSYFTQGICTGAPTVIIPQIRREANSTDIISEEMASWLSSGVSYSGAVLVILSSILRKLIGQKKSFLLISTIAMIGFLILYFANTVTHLIIFEMFEGILCASNITISMTIISEYSSPRYRGFFLTMKSASFLWGIWLSNTIGTFFHWKYIAVVGCIATAYNIITTLKWPESPYWLANRGRLEECIVSHHWLKGHSPESNRELKNLIKRQTTVGQEEVDKDVGNCFQKYFLVLRCKRFFMPLLLSILVLALYNSLGKMACTVYAIDVIKKITGSESIAYIGMLVLDGITIVGMYIGCGISKVTRRRPLLFATSGLGIIFLLLLSLYLSLVKYCYIEEKMYVSLFLLMAFTLSVSCGPMIMATSLVSELLPLSYRNIFTFLTGMFGNIIFATAIKIAPFLFSNYGFSGAFSIYASISLICSVLLYFFLPETKDKTLLEIEKIFMNG